MSKKRNKKVNPNPRRRKTYAQKHPLANSANSSPQEAENAWSRIIFIIILIVAIVGLLLCLIQGGGNTYDSYPGMPFGISSK